MASANKLWSFSTGERGTNRVRAYEKISGGLIFLEFYDRPQTGLISTRQRISLGHRDREVAKAKAEEVASAIRKNERPRSTALTLATLFDNYEVEVTPTKGESTQKHDRLVFRMFLQAFGRNRNPATLNRRDWDRFIAARRNGQLKPKHSRKKGGVRDRVIAYDLQTLNAVLNWATVARDHQGTLLLERNPFKGFPRMERGLKQAKMPKGARYGWHSLRRQFATDLKHVPLPDLCALGGWKDPQTILKCYARPDEGTMRTALESRNQRLANGH